MEGFFYTLKTGEYIFPASQVALRWLFCYHESDGIRFGTPLALMYMTMKDQIIPPGPQVFLMNIDCTAYPRQGLVQNAEGTKAICTALHDIAWFSGFVFPTNDTHSAFVQMSVTSANMDQGCGSASCQFSVEVRYCGYTEQDILKTIKKHTFCTFMVRQASLEAESAA